MRKRILIPIFAIGIAAAVAFAVLSFVDIIPARSVLPGLDANGNAIFIERTYWFSIYELMCADGTLGSTVIFIMSCAVYGLTAVGCASGICLCASARGQKLGKWLFAWRVGGILLPFLTRTVPTTRPLGDTTLYSPVLGAISPDVNLLDFILIPPRI